MDGDEDAPVLQHRLASQRLLGDPTEQDDDSGSTASSWRRCNRGADSLPIGGTHLA
jgi:hypothetical protein